MGDPPKKRRTAIRTATIRFYEELNDFLPPDDRKQDLTVQISSESTVQDLIQSFGVPTAQVDLILVNGRPEHFLCPVRQGDRISVFPVFERLDISSVASLPGRPLRNLKFVAEADLEKLAAVLRSKGFDVILHSSSNGPHAMERSMGGGRILLTTHREIPEQRGLTRAVVVQGHSVDEQLAHVMAQLDLRDQNCGP